MFCYLKTIFISYLPMFINYMSQKNVMITKLLQSMAGIENMPKEINDIIKKNTDNVYYTKDEIDYELLLKIVSKYNITLDSIIPINSGMIAIVFSGVNAEKKRIVIKIKRIDIQKRIAHSYLFLTRIYNLFNVCLGNIDRVRDFLNYFRSFIETKHYILSQCNFTNEINAMLESSKLVKRYNNPVIIPVVYNLDNDIDNSEFIIMDFIDGITLFELTAQNNDNHSEIACSLLGDFAFLTCYFGDIYHTDLHPGNILLIRDGDKLNIGIIDFGMNMLVTDNTRKYNHELMNTFIKLINGDLNVDVLHICKDMTIPKIDVTILSKDEYTRLNNCFIEIINEMFDGNLDDRILFRILEDIKYISKIKHMVIIDDFVKQMMGLSMMNSSIKLLVPDKIKLKKIWKKCGLKIMSY